MDIHFYGSGCKLFEIKDTRIKGRFEDYILFEDYKFTVAICNYPTESLVTEKFTDPITFDCVPIHYGASKINKYFGDRCCIELTGDTEHDLAVIKDVYNNPDNYNYDMTYAKQQLYESYCYFPEMICREFNLNRPL